MFPMGLRLPAAVLASVRRHADASYPEECCGLLLGESQGGEVGVTAAVPAANRAAERRHGFELDPAVLAAALRSRRRGGPAVLGIYHSHPDGTSRPSRRDAAAAWPGWSYLIVPVTVGRSGEPRSFRRDVDGAPLVEEAVEAW